MAQAKQERNGDWLTRERVLVIVLAAVTGIAFYICYQLAEPFLSPLTWALALAVVAHPVHRWIGKRMKAKTLAAALAVLVVTVALIVPVVFVVREIAHEAAAGVEKVKNEATEGRWRKAVEANPRFAGTLKWIEREVNVKEEVERASKWIMNNVGKIVSGSISVVTGLLVTLFLLFYFFRDQERILGALKGLVPLSR